MVELSSQLKNAHGESSSSSVFSYNADGEQIEVCHSGAGVIFGEWVDHHLTLLKKVDTEGNATDEITGYEITDLFGLFRKCFDERLADEIKALIENYINRR
tara:strand:- start:150 stop:452 length:303 start_codon:yes stop_codon:yes gene_type:complete